MRRSTRTCRAAGSRTNRRKRITRQRFAPIPATRRKMLQIDQTDGEGFEPVSVTGLSGNKLGPSPKQGEAESEAVPPDTDLRAVVEAWPGLPGTIKTGILAMVRASLDNN